MDNDEPLLPRTEAPPPQKSACRGGCWSRVVVLLRKPCPGRRWWSLVGWTILLVVLLLVVFIVLSLLEKGGVGVNYSFEVEGCGEAVYNWFWVVPTVLSATDARVLVFDDTSVGGSSSGKGGGGGGHGAGPLYENCPATAVCEYGNGYSYQINENGEERNIKHYEYVLQVNKKDSSLTFLMDEKTYDGASGNVFLLRTVGEEHIVQQLFIDLSAIDFSPDYDEESTTGKIQELMLASDEFLEFMKEIYGNND